MPDNAVEKVAFSQAVFDGGGQNAKKLKKFTTLKKFPTKFDIIAIKCQDEKAAIGYNDFKAQEKHISLHCATKSKATYFLGWKSLTPSGIKWCQKR